MGRRIRIFLSITHGGCATAFLQGRPRPLWPRVRITAVPALIPSIRVPLKALSTGTCLAKSRHETVRQLAFFFKPADAKASRSSLPRRRESRRPRKDWIPGFAGMTFPRAVPSPGSSDNLPGEVVGQPPRGICFLTPSRCFCTKVQSSHRPLLKPREGKA